MKRTRYVSILATAAGMILVMTAGLALAGALAKGKPDSPGIQNGSTVKLEYTLTDEKGTLLDTNKNKEPLSYTHGQGQIIPGLEKALSGLHVGDTKHVVVPPDQAYGPVKPEAVIEIPKERVPEKLQTVGTHLMSRSKDGQPLTAVVKEVKEKTVVLDVNHPLAGKTLTFDIKIVEVEPAQSQKK
ncbi:MAG: peptidylprolyl isomerase [candidate division NC10 bacterium]|nr:peptidylprolyl isomerase [candidate division NC10 bacterium]